MKMKKLINVLVAVAFLVTNSEVVLAAEAVRNRDTLAVRAARTTVADKTKPADRIRRDNLLLSGTPSELVEWATTARPEEMSPEKVRSLCQMMQEHFSWAESELYSSLSLEKQTAANIFLRQAKVIPDSVSEEAIIAAGQTKLAVDMLRKNLGTYQVWIAGIGNFQQAFAQEESYIPKVHRDEDTLVVLVAGGAGFVGSHYVDRLINDDKARGVLLEENGKEKLRIIVVDDLSSGTRDNLAPAEAQAEEKGVELRFSKADIADRSHLISIFEQYNSPDIVVNFAAQVSVPNSVKDPQDDYHRNVAGFLSLIKLASQHGAKKFLYTSSAAIHGDPLPDERLNEESAYDPTSPYGLNKASGEVVTKLVQAVHGLDYTIIRPANIIGRRQTLKRGEPNVMPFFMTRAINGEPFIVFPRPDMPDDQDGGIRDYISVSQIVEAFMVASAGKGTNQTYNAGSGFGLTPRDLADFINDTRRHKEKKPISVVVTPEPRAGDYAVSVFDPSKAQRELGLKRYQHNIAHRAAMRELIDYIYEGYEEYLEAEKPDDEGPEEIELDKRAGLEQKLKSRKVHERRDALKDLAQMVQSGEIEAPKQTNETNNHIHTPFSYSPYYPEEAVWRCYMDGLAITGICDHDTTAGCKDMARAGDILNRNVGTDNPKIKTVNGTFEIKVNLTGTSFEGEVLNWPGVSNIAYMVVHGASWEKLAWFEEKLLKPMREAKVARYKEMIALINRRLSAIDGGRDVMCDWDNEIDPLTEQSNPTDRHPMVAYARKIMKRFEGIEDRQVFVAELLGVKANQVNPTKLEDENDIIGVLRPLILPGDLGHCYIPANETEIPSIYKVIKMCKKAGVILTYPYVGEPDGDDIEERLARSVEYQRIDELMQFCVDNDIPGFALMPHRNTTEQIDALKEKSKAAERILISGVDINRPVESFITQGATNDDYPEFRTVANALVGHEIVVNKLDMRYGITSGAAQEAFPGSKECSSLEERIEFYAQIGEQGELTPTQIAQLKEEELPSAALSMAKLAGAKWFTTLLVWLGVIGVAIIAAHLGGEVAPGVPEWAQDLIAGGTGGGIFGIGAAVKAIQQPRLPENAYIATTPEQQQEMLKSVSINFVQEIDRLVNELMKEEGIDRVSGMPTDQDRRLEIQEKLRKLNEQRQNYLNLGVAAEHNLEEGVRRLVSMTIPAEFEEVENWEGPELTEEITEEELLMRARAMSGEPVLMYKALSRNVNLKRFKTFLGYGCYDHIIPGIVTKVMGMIEFMTGYTQYQPEVSQGMLQALYETQEMMAEIAGMDVSNSSMYDYSSAVAEALLQAFRIQNAQELKDKVKPTRTKAIIAGDVNRNTREVIDTYFSGFGVEAIYVSVDEETGQTDMAALKSLISEHQDDIFAINLQLVNASGGIEENAPDIQQLAHRTGAKFVTGSRILQHGLLESPGALGADIAVIDCQGAGLPMSYGGPSMAVIACKAELEHQLPGRLIGMCDDRKGRRSYKLIKQTREQHISRSEATSNICTSEALCALGVGVYLNQFR